MTDNRCGKRLLASMRDPWALLLSTFGGGAVWAFGASIGLSAATTVVMLATSAAVGAFTSTRHETPARVRAGTRQHGLINLLDGHVRSLRRLASQALPDVVQPKAQDAL